jgi:hypothetical protein
MRTFITLKSLTVTAAVALAVAFSGSLASAGDYHHTPRCVYKSVTVYETVRKPYEYVVTKHDHCGKPYHVTRTGWKTVQVPVTVRVKVLY